MATAPTPKLRWIRFSLATFLFVCLCIGGLIAGYQSGFRAGFSKGQATRYDQTQVSEIHSTAMIVWPDLAADERTKSITDLKNLIQSTIATDLWGDGTGNVIYEYPSKQSLMIVAPGSVQREVRELFAQLEAIHNRGGAEQLLPVLQSLASNAKTKDSPVKIAAPQKSELARAWLEKYYGLTVDGISERWGPPTFRGKCVDAEFPEWSLDQQIATWPRGDGLAYIALRNLDDGQLHIVAGWRAEL